RDGGGGAAAPSTDRSRRVGEVGAPGGREGVARPLRLRASALRDSGAAAAEGGLRPGGGAAAARRRGRHGGRARRRAEAADDEEGRPDGLPAPRRPDERNRDGGLQLGLLGVAGAPGARPRARRQ